MRPPSSRGPSIIRFASQATEVPEHPRSRRSPLLVLGWVPWESHAADSGIALPCPSLVQAVSCLASLSARLAHQRKDSAGRDSPSMAICASRFHLSFRLSFFFARPHCSIGVAAPSVSKLWGSWIWPGRGLVGREEHSALPRRTQLNGGPGPDSVVRTRFPGLHPPACAFNFPCCAQKALRGGGYGAASAMRLWPEAVHGFPLWLSSLPGLRPCVPPAKEGLRSTGLRGSAG